ncbi:hypothetical protein JHJ32_22400 [Parapedobacter sp. ISTM3]|uniref:papain-like cysteine protease family protein n=1 Tax=Parapedobacter sp. ISTM3 TaxID=2800130 RepID=UPI0019041C90|nr:papain-like cysteine protease family protein [Parapedobacter sp. ISTM3]MBK1442761.1 hypothetical protein [Parapedobacter sp. ISTM3]
MKGISSNIYSHGDFGQGLRRYLSSFFEINTSFVDTSIQFIEDRLIRFLKPDLHFLIEYPYVDRLYRNSYYNYYSSKNFRYSKDALRVSIFRNGLGEDNLYDVDFLKENHLGFFVIRPTFPNVLGRNVINPQAFIDSDFSVSKSTFSVTANSLKVKVDGFPHACQDAESMTCAETTLWSIIEYFSNKYNDYNPVLPSDIHRILSELTYERQMPSKGLQAHQISYALKKVGFGVRVYSKQIFGTEFDSILRVYIESGIPLVCCVRGPGIGHAFNVIGRRNISAEQFNDIPMVDVRGNGDLLLKDLSCANNEFVFVDDNFAPYRISSLKFPCEHYGIAQWQQCRITDIIVPLYPKIYMEAGEARKFTQEFLKLSTFAYRQRRLGIRTFLCSSRTYKNYLISLQGVDLDIKKLFLNLSMPKFIWVSEIFDTNDFSAGLIEGVVLLDATEPKSTHVIGAIIDNVFIRRNLSEDISTGVSLGKIKPFNDNLMYYGRN